MTKERNNIVGVTHQSKPIDLRDPYDAAWVANKTIVITGGASGFGEGFFRKWAENGAIVIIGDINDARGKALVEEVRAGTGNDNLHYVHCDVTDWQSQVDFFRSAVQLSPNGGIDAVVANAGMTDPQAMLFQNPKDLDAEEPPKPDLRAYEVNMTGVMYTTHLAFFYLPRSPRSQNYKLDSSAVPSPNLPDRHLLLIGSIASFIPIPVLTQYCVSKHGVLGLFRSLRATSSLQNIRVNLICPYYIDTPLVNAFGRVLLAGAPTGKVEDVVDAGTRFMADTRIVGRALAVGPKIRVDEEGNLLLKGEGKEAAVHEVYANDFEEVDAFTSRFTRIVNNMEVAKGWVGWAGDMIGAFTYPLRSWWRGGVR